MGVGGRKVVAVVIGAILMAGMGAQLAHAATPQPTPKWTTVVTLGSNTMSQYATCWKRGTIGSYIYVGGATGVKATQLTEQMSTTCTVQKKVNGVYQNSWVYGPKKGLGTKGPITIETPDPDGPYVQGTGWQLRTKNTGYFSYGHYATQYFTKYSTVLNTY